MTTPAVPQKFISLERHYNRIDTHDEVFVTEGVGTELNKFVDLAWPSLNAATVFDFYHMLYSLVVLVALPGGVRVSDAVTDLRSLRFPAHSDGGFYEVCIRYKFIDDHSVVIDDIEWRSQ